MNKEEVKQWLRNIIDSSFKPQSNYNGYVYYLCYNKSYIRVLKMSKITGQPVNKEDFKGGEKLFCFDTGNKEFWYYDKIRNYLTENYSKVDSERIKIIEDILNEYDEYKGYKW